MAAGEGLMFAHGTRWIGWALAVAGCLAVLAFAFAVWDNVANASRLEAVAYGVFVVLLAVALVLTALAARPRREGAPEADGSPMARPPEWLPVEGHENWEVSFATPEETAAVEGDVRVRTRVACGACSTVSTLELPVTRPLEVRCPACGVAIALRGTKRRSEAVRVECRECGAPNEVLRGDGLTAFRCASCGVRNPPPKGAA